MAHIISLNPIIYESMDTKQLYIDFLSDYLKIGKWDKRKYESSMLEDYKRIIFESDENKTSNERITINDSPKVNFSGDSEHKLIADRLIKGRRYNLLVYVMNSTQLATNDEQEH